MNHDARHLHFDCFNGVSGDMTLGALVDLGVDPAELAGRLSGLPFAFELKSERVKRQGIMGTLVRVEAGEVADDDHAHGGHGHEHGGHAGHGGHGGHAAEHGHDPLPEPHVHAVHSVHSVHSVHQNEPHAHQPHEHAPHAPHPAHDHHHGHHHHHDDHHHDHVHLADIVAAVTAANLGERATARAIAAYRLIAEAEAKVHGSTPEAIHFHEVGARDAIVDVAGAMVAVEMLGAETFSCSVIATGCGTVRCAHGVMPVPAPATAEILAGMPTVATDIRMELATPTGAAILRVLVGDRGGRGDLAGAGVSPPMRAERFGYGAGTRRIEGHPNMLRATLGSLVAGEPASSDSFARALPVEEEAILELETEIDDMSPEAAGFLLERLLGAGALDAHFQPVQMKKNRPGFRLRALARRDDAARLAEIVLRETSTFGLRMRETRRLCLRRRMEEVETPFGRVPVKVGLWGDDPIKASPEFEACRAVALAAGVPLRDVLIAADEAARARVFSM